MEKEFVPYELAVKLKELGFDEPCLCSWNFYTNELNFNGQPSTFSSEDVTQLPTFSQVFRWFRKKHGLCNFINFSGDGFCSGWEDLGNNEHGFENFKTYEEAELACLGKLIEIAENEKTL